MLSNAKELTRTLFGFLTRKSHNHPQLLMWYHLDESPAQSVLHTDYKIRNFRSGEERAWAELLNSCGELGSWTKDRVRDELLERLCVNGQFFASKGDQLVAGAGLYDGEREGKPCWEIGWVVTHPQHQGLGLGRQVTEAAVRAALALPTRPIFLMTDDFRIPALRLYLKLGFAPDLLHSSYRARWNKLGRRLGQEYKAIIDRYLKGSLHNENSRLF